MDCFNIDIYAELADTSSKALKIMNTLYIDSNEQLKAIINSTNKNYRCFTKNGVLIELRGDNLITRKQMGRRLLNIKTNTYDNEKCVYAYFLLPFIRDSENPIRCQLNSRRATNASYNDNPFTFLGTLEGMYLTKFKTFTADDDVEKWIYNTRYYWEIFSSFKDFLETFCLYEAVNETKAKKDYKKFYSKGWFDKSKGVELFEEYNAALNILIEKRQNELNKRLEEISNA